MGKLIQDIKNFILGKDGSDKEPVDFKTELKNEINNGSFSKADGTILITSIANCDKLAELISKSEEKEVLEASKEDNKKLASLDELENNKEKKDKEDKEKMRIKKVQQQSLEQQIQSSQNAIKAKIESEKNLENQKQIDRK